ncbi:hypothetical protein H9Q74_003486 [Fusarium xylarioides]|nr:hypothetical protein H9Q71_008099 [Fusarium xylarioides]KAG5826446.1 hypothetical protein H9Q74_003486 [Fusarium xylarioides]
MEALAVVANVIAVADISVKILQVCSQYAKQVKNATDDIEELQQETETLHGTAKKVKALIESPQGASLKASQDFAQKLSGTIGVLSEVKLKLETPTKPSFTQRLGFKSLKWPFQSGQMRLTKLNRADSSLKHAITKINKVESRLVLTGLLTAAGAAYNSYTEQDNSTCLKDTRSEILKDIDDWLVNDNSQTIFWLQGMAGTGKSTIARTVAATWDKRRKLGASFFFKRGGGDRGNLSCFYTTIASQLAASFRDLAPSVKAAVDQDQSIASCMAEEQFEKLILQPILTLRPINNRVIAIVIDAVDECDSDENIKRLISILT